MEYNPPPAGQLPVPDFSFINDYRTVNNFNGGELGLNAVYTLGRWSLDVVGKAAIGVNNQYVRLYNQETIDESNIRATGTRSQMPTAAAGVLAKPFLGHSGTHVDRRIPGHGPLQGHGGLRPAVLDGRRSRGGSDRRRASATGFPYGTAAAGNYCLAAAVRLQRVALLGPGLASGRRLPLLGEQTKVKTKKGREPRGPLPSFFGRTDTRASFRSLAHGLPTNYKYLLVNSGLKELMPDLPPDSIDKQAGDARAEQHEGRRFGHHGEMRRRRSVDNRPRIPSPPGFDRSTPQLPTNAARL